ncbi:MAG: hypothetical protein NWQ55_01295, partial [Salibacteraceae bacterium]|nr:hypothetical protein [Salibacteraceae bacterium]
MAMGLIVLRAPKLSLQSYFGQLIYERWGRGKIMIKCKSNLKPQLQLELQEQEQEQEQLKTSSRIIGINFKIKNKKLSALAALREIKTKTSLSHRVAFAKGCIEMDNG